MISFLTHMSKIPKMKARLELGLEHQDKMNKAERKYEERVSQTRQTFQLKEDENTKKFQMNMLRLNQLKIEISDTQTRIEEDQKEKVVSVFVKIKQVLA